MKNRAAIKALSTTAFFIIVASLCVSFQHSRDIVKNVKNSKKQLPPGLRKLLQQGEEVLADDDSDQVDCGDVHKQPGNETCSFVQNTDDCAIDEGFVNYLEVVYCTFSPALVPFGVFLFFVWWLFLFVGLAVTADEFFCPCLAIISEVLRLSHNIAGVTLLAFGNGAPDVFSAISAIGNAKNGNAGLAFGALLGAGMFVTTVVTGAVAFVVPFHVMERPFLRDIAFYIMSLWFTFYILWSRKIHIAQAVAYLLIYAVYVAVVVIGRFIYQKHRARTNTNDDSIRGSIQERIEEEQKEDDVGAFPFGQSLEVPPVHGHNIQDDLDARPKKAVKDFARFAEQISAAAALGNAGDRALQPQISEMEEDADSEQTPLLGSQEADSSQWTEFLRAVNPINVEDWPEMRWYARAYEVFKCPLVAVLKLTIPVVDKDQEKDNWNRPLATIHCITAPIACALLTNGVDKMVGSIPSGVFVLILGLLLALVVVWTSQNDQPPVYHSAFAFMGFVVAVIWIYSIANEIVNLLQMFGIVFGISNAILGLTLLAWGNSIGDLIADTVMARQGFPRMGISACFGGPLFNLLLGIGIPFTLGTIKQGSLTGVYEMTLDISLQEILLSIFLCFSLLSSFILLPILRFKIGKCYAIYLLSVYVVFLVMALLVETDVITADVTSWTI